MKIEIDQSGKVEYTSQPTVIAFTNSKKATICISSREKRIVQQAFRSRNQSRLFVYRTFSALIYLLIRTYITSISHIIIDLEYKGHEKDIREMILEYLRKDAIQRQIDIRFRRIGNKPPVHYLAHNTFQKKLQPTYVVKAKDILKIAIKKDRGSKS